MTDNEKKKINDKKYNRNNTIIAVVGVILIAILFITCLDANAFDDMQGTFIPFDEFVLYGTSSTSNTYRVTVNSSIAVGATVMISYIIKTDVVQDFYVYIYRNNTYGGSPMISSTSNYLGGYYNSYETHYLVQTNDVLQITVPNTAVIYGLYLYYVESDGTPSMNNYNQIVANKLVELNKSKFINQMIKVDAYDDDLVNMYSINEGYISSMEYYTNIDNTITVNGQIAITNGVSNYRLTINNISKGIIDNPTNSYSLTDEFVSFVNTQNLNITNFDINGNYQFFINLDEYVGQMVSISVSAEDVNGILYNCFVLPIVYVYQPEIDTETESDTEDESESPDFDNNSQYEQGYKDALTQLSKTPLFYATVEGTVVIRDTTSGEESTSIIEQTISFLTNGGGYKLGSIDGSLSIIKENNPDKDVYLKSLKITFNRDFVFTNGLVWFGSPYAIPAFDTSGNEGYVSYYRPQITIKGRYEDGVYFTSDAYYYTVSPLDNWVGSESPYLYEMRVTDSDRLGLLKSIEFTNIGTDLYEAFKNSIIYIPYNNYIKIEDAESYGHIMGWYKGWQQGLMSQSNVSYQKGFAEGEKKVTDEAFTNGYNKGLEDANSLRTVILAPFDGITNLMTGMLNVNILGFNLLDLIGGLLMALLVIWVARRVL